MLDLPERLAPGGLRGELGTELGLVPRPAQEDDQMAGDGERGVAPQVLLHEREGEIDPGGDTGRRHHPAVANVDGPGVDLDGRVVAGEPVAVLPVGGRAQTVQETRGGEQERSRADGHQPFGARPVHAQPVGQTRIRGAGARAAGDQQGVRYGRVGESPVRYEDEAAGGADGLAGQRGRTDAVGARMPGGGLGEHLDGAGDIEDLDVVEEDDEDGSLRHAQILGGHGRWPQ